MFSKRTLFTMKALKERILKGLNSSPDGKMPFRNAFIRPIWSSRPSCTQFAYLWEWQDWRIIYPYLLAIDDDSLYRRWQTNLVFQALLFDFHCHHKIQPKGKLTKEKGGIIAKTFFCGEWNFSVVFESQIPNSTFRRRMFMINTTTSFHQLKNMWNLSQIPQILSGDFGWRVVLNIKHFQLLTYCTDDLLP